MKKTPWTEQQKLAIRTTEADVLLTAAAGSGKTAVLAERCVYLLTDAPHRCTVNDLLVLTFTEAAAAEMRRRIAQALRRRDRELPRHPTIHRQLALIDQAPISTVHAFCRSVLREFFHAADIDPEFEMIDEDEAKLIRRQIAEEVFEEFYLAQEHSETGRIFGDFIRRYGTEQGDQELVFLAIRLSNFLHSLQNHQAWRHQCRAYLDAEDSDHLHRLRFVERQRGVLRRQTQRMIARLEYGLDLIRAQPELDFYQTYIKQDLLLPLREIRTLLERGWQQACTRLEEFDLRRAPARPKNFSGDAEEIKAMLAAVRDGLKELRSRFLGDDAYLLAQMNQMRPYGRLLLELQERYQQKYQKCKQQRNVLDFDDLEQKCLDLLVRRDQAGAVVGVSDLARQLQQRFAYILVDEYQDISPVQDQIIRCLSRTGAAATDSSSASSLLKPSERRGNLFMVGDVKQSIYGFRQADHRIILDKMNAYTPMLPEQHDPENPPASQVRINLNTNFRSRREIVEAVNYIFTRTMTKPFAELDYDQNAQLVFGAEYYDTPCLSGETKGLNKTAASPLPVEIHLIESHLHNDGGGAGAEEEISPAEENAEPSRRELDAARREAVLVGRRIRQIVGDASAPPEFELVDPQARQRRPVRYRDIVILLRSMKNHAEVWAEVFRQMNIPVHAELSTGYLAATEIRDMVSLLQVLDNPRQDIPLAAVLRSPIGALDESDLTKIRLAFPRETYHHAVFLYAEKGPDLQLQERLKLFFERLDRWRRRERQGRLAAMIWQVYQETDLLAFVRGLSQGHQRYRNLIQLHDRARQFDHFTRQGLTRFLHFLEQIQEEQQDFGPAPVLCETDNVVRIMSIHKSKGLEFPVVIIADLARRFHMPEKRNPVLFGASETCPLGLTLINKNTMERWSTVARNLLLEDMEFRQKAEELRVLYVALTRARERLILTANINLQTCARQWHNLSLCADQPLPEFFLSDAPSPIQWIGGALADHQDFARFLQEYSSGPLTPNQVHTHSRFHVETYSADRVRQILEQEALRTRRPHSVPDLAARLSAVSCPDDDPRLAAVRQQLAWRYPHEGLTRLSARRSVTEMKRFWNPEQNNLEKHADFAPNPAISGVFPAATGIEPAPPFSLRPRLSHPTVVPTANEIGSWTHLFLQHVELQPELTTEKLAEQLARMVQQGLLTKSQSKWINLNNIARFFADPLGRQLRERRAQVRREWPFTLALPAGEIYPHAALHPVDARQPVLLRGIIDCFFETDRGIVIVDYKTDRITSEQCAQRAAFYQSQMLYYRRAVEDILKKSVAESYFYFFHPACACPILFP